MAIKNYTTTIDPAKTAGEITSILARSKARRIQHEYDDDGFLTGISFSVQVNGSELFYKLPSRADGVLSTLVRDRVEKRFRNIDQARRVSWRIVKDWVGAQLALVDAGSAKVTEVFLPYLLVGPDETLFERVESQGIALLLAGGDPRLEATIQRAEP